MLKHRSPTRPSIADQLEGASHELDLLIRDARLIPCGRQDQHLADLEERGIAIVTSIVAALRGTEAASAAPIAIEMLGKRARAWF